VQPRTTLGPVPFFRRRKVARRWPRELPEGYLIRFNGRATKLTADEAIKLADAVNHLFHELMNDGEFFEGVEIADAIEAAWEGMEAPEKELTESLASDFGASWKTTPHAPDRTCTSYATLFRTTSLGWASVRE